MKKLPYTYRSKQKYWRFRHPTVGDFPLRGELGSPSFMKAYGELLAKVGGALQPKEPPKPRLKQEPDERPAYIYFIKSPRGSIKIGISTNVKKRLSNLQTANHEPLELVAHFPGTRRMERIIHRELGDCWESGEWFRPTQKLFSVIDHLREASKK